VSDGRGNVVGVPDAGVDRLRPRRKRGRRAGGAGQELLPEGARVELATGFDACGVASGARRFVDEEPTGRFVWIFFNRDGTMSEYPTELESYRMFVRLYGVPAGRWRQ